MKSSIIFIPSCCLPPIPSPNHTLFSLSHKHFHYSLALLETIWKDNFDNEIQKIESGKLFRFTVFRYKLRVLLIHPWRKFLYFLPESLCGEFVGRQCAGCGWRFVNWMAESAGRVSHLGSEDCWRQDWMEPYLSDTFQFYWQIYSFVFPRFFFFVFFLLINIDFLFHQNFFFC